jgi:hypothetical protein
MRSAFIENNKVGTIREVSYPDHPMWVLLNEGEVCHTGMLYRPNETPRFAFPEPAPKPVEPKAWTAFQFLLRFTEQERETFRVAALTDGKVADFMQLCGAASEVEANHPLTVAGMAYLVSQDLLTQARADEVLGN